LFVNHPELSLSLNLSVAIKEPIGSLYALQVECLSELLELCIDLFGVNVPAKDTSLFLTWRNMIECFDLQK
jgi:hypothetical protein